MEIEKLLEKETRGDKLAAFFMTIHRVEVLDAELDKIGATKQREHLRTSVLSHVYLS